jgi:hypothetical protein
MAERKRATAALEVEICTQGEGMRADLDAYARLAACILAREPRPISEGRAQHEQLESPWAA